MFSIALVIRCIRKEASVHRKRHKNNDETDAIEQATKKTFHSSLSLFGARVEKNFSNFHQLGRFEELRNCNP